MLRTNITPSPKRKRKLWNKEVMMNAVTAVRKKRMGFNSAAKEFNIPRTTLRRFVKDSRSVEEVVEQRLGRKPVGQVSNHHGE